NPVIKIPNEKMLEEMVYKEEEFRMSEPYQIECTRVKDIPNGWLDITAEMQRRLVQSFGFEDTISCDLALNMLRRAHIIYPDNPVFTRVPVQVRCNKARKGNRSVGDVIPDFTIWNLEGVPCKLSSLRAPTK